MTLLLQALRDIRAHAGDIDLLPPLPGAAGQALVGPDDRVARAPRAAKGVGSSLASFARSDEAQKWKYAPMSYPPSPKETT